ncbi:NAD-dependent epimerase/dehydratase family protein [Rhodobacter ferrooxidans]|uniref:NAD-dependent epimerase/dehydratase n=1 Tax=Rhodobacter ferrooxidans TaxID=371731 RepID=C8S379_9RHOB|nr:NAD-dependent epimerase/dehydratase family protein [Rhodobacter sp. SW2]EEW24561.1 NAD-dependent epimerase/dehydratase [Rhodobacter sp. SW2]
MITLVIGGSGFIGSHLVDELLAAGHRVRVFDRSPERFRAASAGVDLVQGDLGDTALLAEALSDVGQVFHLVSTTVPATSNLDPAADIRGNLINTVRLLELMRAAKVRRMVYLSSGGTVYGIPQTDPVAETHRLQPISSYGIVKVAVENYLMMEAYLHGLEPVILRASNPYGPRQGHGGVQGVIGTFLWKIAQGDPIQIWGDGSVVRDFIHVRDLAQLCVLAAETGIVGTFNAGSGAGHSIAEVVDTIAAVTGRKIVPLRKEGRGFDVPRVVLDISAIRATTGWAPTIPLQDGIAETWAWVCRQGVI